MIYFYILVAGALSILGQVVLFRELINVFSGSELVLVFGFGLLLLSSSIGVFSSKTSSLKRAKLLFFLFALSFLVLFLFCSSLRPFFGTTRGLVLSIDRQFASILFILFPFGFLCGKLFGELSLLALKEGALPSKTYAIDTIGAVIGGFVSFIFNIFSFPQSLSALFITFAALYASFAKRKILFNSLLAAILVLIFLPFNFFVNSLHFSILKIEDSSLKEMKETPYGRISVSSDEGQAALFFNNSLCFESESVSSEDIVHLPLLCAPNPKKILLIGGTAEGVLKEVLKHNPEKIDVVELDKEMVDLPKKYIIDERFEGLKDSRTTLHIVDGRSFINHCEKYDAIIVSSMGQNSIAENRFFTQQYFKECFNKIKENGVLAFRLKGAENYQTEILLKRNASIIKPLSEIFDKVMIFPQSTVLVVALKGKEISFDEIEKRFEERKIVANLVSPAYLKYLWENERRSNTENVIFQREWERNSDLKPVAYLLTLIIEAGRNFPEIFAKCNVFESLKKAFLFIVFIFFAGLLSGKFLLKIEKSTLTVFAAGFWGMAFEISLLVYYQLRNGVLYKDIGILTSLFMSGLAIGASFFPKKIGDYSRLIYICFVVLFSAGIAFLLNVIFIKTIFFILILFGGFLSGSLFKIAESLSKEKGDGLLRKLYFNDLFGGAFGAVFSTLFLIPVFGIKSSFYFMALLTLLCL